MLAAGLCLVALSSCEWSDLADGAGASCSPGAAAIGVTDGMVARLCGCAEGGGGWQTFDAGMTCTVANGTTVVFHYISTRLRHQVITAPASAASFAPSPVSDPFDSPVIRAHGVTLSTGTYTVSDTFDSRLNAVVDVL